jgi:hypothetical protein
MSPGSPDASDELQVIPRRPSGGPPAPTSKPPPSERPSEADAEPARHKRLVRIVAVALGLCAFILIAAGIAKALRPHDAAATAGSAAASSPSASASAAPPPADTTPAPTAAPAPALPAAAPTTGTVFFDRPATPGKIWIDGKKITAKSVDVPCGNHRIKIGSGKTKPVIVTCGAELHLTH